MKRKLSINIHAVSCNFKNKEKFLVLQQGFLCFLFEKSGNMGYIITVYHVTLQIH